MRIRKFTCLSAVVVALVLTGCASAPGNPGSGSCGRVGLPDGADDVEFNPSPADDGYLLRGKAITGFEIDEIAPVEGIKVTVVGEDFSVVLCSDASGEWGDFLPAAAPYTLTLEKTSVPEGLELLAPSADSSGTIEMGEQAMYPLQVTLNFGATGDVESEPKTDLDAQTSNGEGVCETYFAGLANDRTLTSARDLPANDVQALAQFGLPEADCAMEVAYPNGVVAVYLGWEGADFSGIQDALVSGGLTATPTLDAPTGRRTVLALDPDSAGQVLYSGDAINPGIDAEDVMLVFQMG